MTNPSELSRKLRKEADVWAEAVHTIAGPATAVLLREAADTIDRLTSSGEAVAWQKPVCPYCKGSGVEADYVGPEMRPIATTCSHCNGEGFDPDASPPASPSEGHVEDAEALRVAREVISDMVRYGHITTETGTTAYYVGENVLPTIMGRPLPHNQGETKPEAWDLAARAENGETNL